MGLEGHGKNPDPKIQRFSEEEQQEDLTSNIGGVQIKSRCLNAKTFPVLGSEW